MVNIIKFFDYEDRKIIIIELSKRRSLYLHVCKNVYEYETGLQS